MIAAPVSGALRPQALIDPLRSESSRLDPGVRAELERSLGAPFGDVVVHTGPASAAAAERADAAAFTVGRHVVFGLGAYQPRTTRGRMLLAHELAHVAQQRRGGGDLDLGTSRSEASIGHVASGEAAARVAASRVADGQSAAVSGAAPVGIAREDKKEEEKSWREKLWDKTKERIREQAKTTLGQIEGVTIEAGQIVDTVVWVPYAAIDATDAVIDAASQKLGVSEKTAATIKSAVPGGPALKALRKEAAKAGMVDPDTGAPIVSGKITEGFTAAEKALDKHVFTGMKKEEGFFTDREIGQLQGAIGAQIALSFVGVEEVQLALKVVSAVGVVKTIVSAMQRNPKGFMTDRVFWTAIANAFLHVAGLKSASSGKKITTLVVDVLSVTLASTNEILQLRQDMALPPGPERDRAIARDIQALIRVVAGAVQQALSHHKSLKAAAAKTTAAVADPIEGPPAVGSTSLKPAPATGTETPAPPTTPSLGPKAPALQASGEVPSTKLRVAVPDADATAPKVRIAHPEDAPPRVRVATEEAGPKVRVAEPDTELADAAPEAKRMRAVAAEAAPRAKSSSVSATDSVEPEPPRKASPGAEPALLAPPVPATPAGVPAGTQAGLKPAAKPTVSQGAPVTSAAAAPGMAPRPRSLKETQLSTKAARKRLDAAVARKKLAEDAVTEAKSGVATAQQQLAAAKAASPATKASVKAAERHLARAQKSLESAREERRLATDRNVAAKKRFHSKNQALGTALAAKAKREAAAGGGIEKPRLGPNDVFDPQKFRRPDLDSVKVSVSANDVDFIPRLPDGDPRSGLRTKPNALVSVFHDPISSRIAPVKGATPQQLGHDFERALREDLTGGSKLRESHSAGDKTRHGDIGAYETKYKTRLSSDDLDQLWRDLSNPVRKNSALVIVPKLHPRDAVALTKMAAMYERASGVRPHIAVRETEP